MKKLIVALVALLPLTSAVQAQSLKDMMVLLRAKWNKPTEPFKIIDNVYYVGTDGLASYLITSPQGHILVDTVMPESTAQIKAGIAKLGYFSDEKAKIFQDLKLIGKAFGMPTSILIDASGCEIGSIAGPAEWASDDALKLVRAALGR